MPRRGERKMAPFRFDVEGSIIEVPVWWVDEPAVAQWETFRERYNQLRGAWERYSERMFAVTGLSATIPGRPARSLNPARVRRAEQEVA